MRRSRAGQRSPTYPANVVYEFRSPGSSVTITREELLKTSRVKITVIGAQRVLRRKYANPTIRVLQVVHFE